MAFIEDTPIFTDSGWKNIEDISGHDKVLVRNFLGEAELIQPFAVKKRKYNGKIIKIGAKDWSFSVTPEHIVAYDRSRYGRRSNFMLTPAKDYKIDRDDRIYRKFRYIFPDQPKREDIKLRDVFGVRYVIISDYDWYKLVGYVLMRGFIRTKPGKPMLYIFLEEENMQEEIKVIGDILDRLGVGWHVQYSKRTRAKIVVSSKNTLVNRLVTRLSSKRRKEMFLPDKMIYNSTKELSKLLIETIITASLRAGTERKQVAQISTTNKALIDSMTLFGTLAGYSVRHVVNVKAGEDTYRGVTKRTSYIMQISSPVDYYSPKHIKKSIYEGNVYEIDIFDGQVYTRKGSMPVWVNPK